jgi:NADH:ubiquinone oxidoreductase subunit H
MLRLAMILLCVAVLTLAERGALGSMQRRVGPVASGLYGRQQPIWYGLKLGLCEPIIPNATSTMFIWAPVGSFVLSQLVWSIVPLPAGVGVSYWTSGAFAVAALSGLAVYAVLFAGWTSNLNYGFLGGCRSF